MGIGLLGLIAAVLGCSSSDMADGLPSQTLARIRVNPSPVLMAPGDQIEFTASCTTSGNIPVPCPSLDWTFTGGTWQLSPGTDTAGTFTAGPTQGNYTITAREGTITGQAGISVIPGGGGGGGPANVTVNSAQTFQTWQAWTATLSSGWLTTISASRRGSMISEATRDLGITYFRIAINPGMETVNDNNDPFTLNPAPGIFNWNLDELNLRLNDWLLPLRDTLTAAGMPFGWQAHVGNWSTTPAFIRNNPEEYGEFALATLQHLQQVTGMLPNEWVVRNEPDGSSNFSPAEVAAWLEVVHRRFTQAGYNIPLRVPEVTNPNNAVSYLKGILASPGITPAMISSIGYHRYSKPAANTLPSIDSAAKSLGITTYESEWLDASIADLYEDLTIANVSRWERYALAGPGGGDVSGAPGTGGGQLIYYDTGTGTWKLRPYTYLFRQYFKYIVPNSTRIGASATLGTLKPVAFRRPDGKIVTVVQTTGAGTVAVGGLPAGTYHVTYALQGQPTTGPTIVLQAGQVISVVVPSGPAVVTVSP